MNKIIENSIKGIGVASHLAAKGFASLVIGSAVVTATVIIPSGITGVKTVIRDLTK